MSIPRLSSSGPEAYRKPNEDDDQGPGKPDKNGGLVHLTNDEYRREIEKEPDGPTKDYLRMLSYSGGAV